MITPQLMGKSARQKRGRQQLRTPILAVVATLVAGTTLADNNDACDVEATGEIHLSSKDRRDVIRASVRGKSCDGAVFSLSIQAPDGRIIYRYQKRLRPFLSILAEVSDADAQVRARRLVESTILGAEGRT